MKMEWIDHYNRWPREEKTEITFEEFFMELGRFADYSKRESRQIRYFPDILKGYADIYVFKRRHLPIGIGFGKNYNEMNEEDKVGKMTCWKFGTEEEFTREYNKQAAYFANDNS